MFVYHWFSNIKLPFFPSHMKGSFKVVKMKYFSSFIYVVDERSSRKVSSP